MAPEFPKSIRPPAWTAAMRDELARMPETAANIREASENLKRVSAELVDVSALLAQIVRVMDATGMTEGLQRAEKISNELDTVRKALTPPTSIDEARERLTQVESLVAGLGGRAMRVMGLTARPEDAATEGGAAGGGPDSTGGDTSP